MRNLWNRLCGGMIVSWYLPLCLLYFSFIISFPLYSHYLTGEFEYEEFRDFYIKYLDSDESLNFLREYAKHRFRDIEHEKMVKKEQLERENRARRRAYLKIKYYDLVEAQKAKFRDNSIVDVYGNRRRLYRHRTRGGVSDSTVVIDSVSGDTAHKKGKRGSTPNTNNNATNNTNTNTPGNIHSITHYTADNIDSIDEADFIERGLMEEGYGEQGIRESHSLGFGESHSAKSSATSNSSASGLSGASSVSSVLKSNVATKRRTVLTPIISAVNSFNLDNADTNTTGVGGTTNAGPESGIVGAAGGSSGVSVHSGGKYRTVLWNVFNPSKYIS